jgi:hypothetical protein
MTVDDVIARAAPDSQTLGFPILRIDSVDHLILVATNVVKDMFVDAPAHVQEDLSRLVRLVDPEEIVERARQGRFATGMYLVARWMTEGGHAGFESIEAALTPFRRRGFAASVRAMALLRSKQEPFGTMRRKGAWSPVSVTAFVLACATCDDLAIRTRCLATLARRLGRRALGLEADTSR